MLKLRNIYKTFNAGTINEKRALDDINLISYQRSKNNSKTR